MYEVKSKIFLEFSKTQKTALCNHLRSLVKNFSEKTTEEILEEFVENEKYYQNISASRFVFLEGLLDCEKFLKESDRFIRECKKFYDYKKSLAPMIQAQKEFDKKKRKFLQEVKMSKEAPTKKQISYYNSLCKRWQIEKQDASAFSKLDLRNEIDRIINEHKID